ncbi:hypothetical protein V5F77_26660 [Xanthobacter sp. DSM 24535]|uniref:hypothetical protein n=1 Tax=Roseixanthobacter psychrophilus TaxID=3119917 RepID=UPI0037299125
MNGEAFRAYVEQFLPSAFTPADVSPVTVGLRWNGAYAATLLVLSQLLVALALHTGWL